MKKLILLVAFGMMIGFSCKKEEIVPLPSPQPNYVYKVYDPPLSCGWAGQTSFEDDSTFVLHFSVDKDTLYDFTLTIKEGMLSFMSGSQWITLPMQTILLSGSKFAEHNYLLVPSANQEGIIIDSVLCKVAVPFEYIVYKNPAPWVLFPEGWQYIPIVKRADGDSYYGWIKLKILGCSVFSSPEVRAVVFIEESYLSLEPNQSVIAGVVD